MIATRSAIAGGLQEYNATFLQNFIAREAQERAARQEPTPSIVEHAAHRAQLTDVRFIKPKYSDQTEINNSAIFNKWRRCVKLSC